MVRGGVESDGGRPKAAALAHWRQRAEGLGVEVAFILGLILVGFALAIVATVIW